MMMEKADDFVLTVDDVYIVWWSKTLQNWKAPVSTTVSDEMYYEVTYNGDKQETYIDAFLFLLLLLLLYHISTHKS